MPAGCLYPAQSAPGKAGTSSGGRGGKSLTQGKQLTNGRGLDAEPRLTPHQRQEARKRLEAGETQAECSPKDGCFGVYHFDALGGRRGSPGMFESISRRWGPIRLFRFYVIAARTLKDEQTACGAL
jgi:hypothetical protein